MQCLKLKVVCLQSLVLSFCFEGSPDPDTTMSDKLKGELLGAQLIFRVLGSRGDWLLASHDAQKWGLAWLQVSKVAMHSTQADGKETSPGPWGIKFRLLRKGWRTNTKVFHCVCSLPTGERPLSKQPESSLEHIEGAILRMHAVRVLRIFNFRSSITITVSLTQWRSVDLHVSNIHLKSVRVEISIFLAIINYKFFIFFINL